MITLHVALVLALQSAPAVPGTASAASAAALPTAPRAAPSAAASAAAPSAGGPAGVPPAGSPASAPASSGRGGGRFGAAPPSAAGAPPPPSPFRGTLRPKGNDFERKRDYDLQHLTFDVDFDLKARSLKGVATNSIAAITPGLREARFDAEYLTIDKVTVGGHPAKFAVEKAAVVVTLPKALATGDKADVAITYHGKPPSGLHWVGPEAGYPDKPYQVWSQGEDMDNHLWIPTWDYPNDKTSWDAILTVPDDLVAVSNGVLVSEGKGPRPGTKTFHYRMSEPNVTYLIAVAVGPWQRYADKWRGKPVEYFVSKGIDEDMARRSFGKTPSMIDYFSQVSGVDYPWNKYAQVAVAEFVVGGMENVSCTLQTDRTLHDDRSQLDGTSDGLVAHELAHQWWGDLLTCRDWSHLWLNEGFATYFAALWDEHAEGRSAFRMEMRNQQAGFRAADPPNDPRPLVETFFSTPDGDRTHNHQYTKGSSVLHMLRFVLGDDLFWKGIRLYAKRHAGGSVDTEDLRRAMAEVSGDPLEWFFEQWVYAAGYPQFEVATAWDDKSKTETVTVKQVQKLGGLVPLFKMPVDVALWSAGKPRVERVWVSSAQDSFTFKLPARPDFVRFDEGGWLLKTLKMERTPGALVAQLEHDDDPTGQVEAIDALADLAGNDQAAAALTRFARDGRRDRFVRAPAVRALAGFHGNAGARATVLAALGDKDAHVRAAAAAAAGAFTADAGVAAALEKAMTGDRSPDTQATAVQALARVLGKAGWDRVAKGLAVASFRDRVKAATMEALARLDLDRALPMLLGEARYGKPYETRMPAMSLLGDAAPEVDAATRRQITELLAEGAKDDLYPRARQAALRNLAATGTAEARTTLERIAKEDEREPFRKAAKDNVERMTRVDHLTEENRRLKARVDELEKKLHPAAAVAGAPGSPAPAATAPTTLAAPTPAAAPAGAPPRTTAATQTPSGARAQ